MIVSVDGSLPSASRVPAIVAHPDDETFKLGALLATFAVVALCPGRSEAVAFGSDLGDLAGQLSRPTFARACCGRVAVATETPIVRSERMVGYRGYCAVPTGVHCTRASQARPRPGGPR